MNSVLWRGCVGRFVLSCPASEGCVGRFVLSRPAIELVHSNQSVLKNYTGPTGVGHHQAVGWVQNIWAIFMAVGRVSVETGYEEARRAVPKVCSCRYPLSYICQHGTPCLMPYRHDGLGRASLLKHVFTAWPHSNIWQGERRGGWEEGRGEGENAAVGRMNHAGVIWHSLNFNSV